MHRHKAGFTIVELLIIIVVIGVLVSLAIVGYAGMSDRAYRSQYASALKTYQTSLQLYKEENGRYPLGDTCLSELSSLPADVNLASGECTKYFYTSGSTYSAANYNAPVVTSIKKFLPSLPTVPNKTFQGTQSWGTFYTRGIKYTDQNGDGTVAGLSYIVSLSASCPDLQSKQPDYIGPDYRGCDYQLR